MPIMKKIILIGLLGICSSSYAGLQALDNESLGEVNAQAGADISLNLVLNQVGGTAANRYDYNCAPIEFCRIAINLNNRSTSAGNKQWLVFKGVQGTITIPNIKLDGVDLTYKPKVGADIVKPAIQLSFDGTTPILVRNFGFKSLSIETDSMATPANGVEPAGNISGYLAKSSGGAGAGIFAAGIYTAAGFDNNREVGFTGITMNGNLALQGKIQMFSCDATHPRC